MSGPSTSDAAASSSSQPIDAIPAHLTALADLISSEPERFASADANVLNLASKALKDVFDLSVQSEAQALPEITKFLNETFPPEEPVSQSTRSGKRKRSSLQGGGLDGVTAQQQTYHPLFQPTPLSELVIDGMDPSQVWEQLEFRGKKVCQLLDTVITTEQPGQADEEDAEDADEEDGDEDDDDEEEDEDEDEENIPQRKIVHSLKELSDADLRALGIDPSMRAELEALDDGSSDEDEEDDEDGEGYPGASDLSDDEEAKAIVEMPLLSEEQQQRRKAAAEAAELRRLRSQQRAFEEGSDEEEGEEVDEEEEDEDEEDSEDDEEREAYLAKLDPELRRLMEQQEQGEDGLLDDSEEDDGDVEDEDSEQENVAPAKKQKVKSLLDSLDEPGDGAGKIGKSGPKHPTLDDDFFSIDQFNQVTEDMELGKNGALGNDDEDAILDDVDLFADPGALDDPMPSSSSSTVSSSKGRTAETVEEGPDASDMLYDSFFAPPRYARKPFTRGQNGKPASASSKTVGKGKAKADGEPAATPFKDAKAKGKGDATPPSTGRRSVHFNESVAVRFIKPRRKAALELSPEMLAAMRAGAPDGEDEEDDVEMDEEDDDEDDEDAEGEEEEEEEEDEEMDEDDEEEVEASSQAESEEDHEAAVARRVAGDLFADDEDQGEQGAQAQSTYEKRMAALQEDIERLEQENVGPKDWTVMGEAGSKARPQNSLLEEDLEFQHTGKAKPVITEETTKGLEELIKKRILDSLFDDVERRRTVEATAFLPSRLLELSDSKSARSLAELYEDEFQAAKRSAEGEKPLTPEADAKLEKEHKEIKALFDDLFSKLDALSNAHFTPKAPKASIQTLSNAPAITMETALPSTATSASMLAPEEMYESNRFDSALVGDRSEMDPEEKRRLQKRLRTEKRRNNERIEESRKQVEINAKAFGRSPSLAKRGRNADKGDKDEALKKLVGNRGVTVIGKQSKKEGKGAAASGGAAFKGKPNGTPSGAALKL